MAASVNPVDAQIESFVQEILVKMNEKYINN